MGWHHKAPVPYLTLRLAPSAIIHAIRHSHSFSLLNEYHNKRCGQHSSQGACQNVFATIVTPSYVALVCERILAFQLRLSHSWSAKFTPTGEQTMQRWPHTVGKAERGTSPPHRAKGSTPTFKGIPTSELLLLARKLRIRSRITAGVIAHTAKEGAHNLHNLWTMAEPITLPSPRAI